MKDKCWMCLNDLEKCMCKKKDTETADPVDELVMPYWEISPHESTEYDCCVLPAETEKDHRAALDYAQARLESMWDSTAWEDMPKKVCVTMEIKNERMPDFDSEA